jgi:hypothetical protein
MFVREYITATALHAARGKGEGAGAFIRKYFCTSKGTCCPRCLWLWVSPQQLQLYTQPEAKGAARAFRVTNVLAYKAVAVMRDLLPPLPLPLLVPTYLRIKL